MSIECTLKKEPTHKNASFLLKKLFYYSCYLFLFFGHATQHVFCFSFSWAPKSLQMVTAAMKLKDACSLEEKL